MKKVKKLTALILSLKSWLKKKVNHLKVKPYKDWDELPAKKFFKVLENNDLRHILKRYVIDYDQSRLIAVYENIMRQYEEGMNDKSYSNHLRIVKDNLKKENEINGLVICLELFKIDPKVAKEQLKYYKIELKDNTYESLIHLRNIISGKRTTLTIDSLQNETEKGKTQSFEDTLVHFEDVLKLQIKENISLKKWVSYYKQSKQKIKQKKKHGRTA